MKAISIKQPWAWAIIHAGKTVENRSWPSRYTGPLLIHASKTYDHQGYCWLLGNRDLLKAKIPARDDFHMGGIIGRVKMVDCVSWHSSPFFFGEWGHLYENPEPIIFYPCKGKLGIFDIDWIEKGGNDEIHTRTKGA